MSRDCWPDPFDARYPGSRDLAEDQPADFLGMSRAASGSRVGRLLAGANQRDVLVTQEVLQIDARQVLSAVVSNASSDSGPRSTNCCRCPRAQP